MLFSIFSYFFDLLCYSQASRTCLRSFYESETETDSNIFLDFFGLKCKYSNFNPGYRFMFESFFVSV